MSKHDAKTSKRLVLCMGRYCNQGGQAEPLEACLRRYLGERGPTWRMKGPVKWEIANCLSMCGAGPNAVVYPDDVSYNHLDVHTLEALVQQLLHEAEENKTRP
jgi:(2Fe-2S) ferredoxin